MAAWREHRDESIQPVVDHGPDRGRILEARVGGHEIERLLKRRFAAFEVVGLHRELFDHGRCSLGRDEPDFVSGVDECLRGDGKLVEVVAGRILPAALQHQSVGAGTDDQNFALAAHVRSFTEVSSRRQNRSVGRHHPANSQHRLKVSWIVTRDLGALACWYGRP